MSQPLTMFIACHRPCPVPAEPCYLPVEVGAALHPAPIPGFTPDNTGDNISCKNEQYCELTALYWAWKNADADDVGLVHYRRYFSNGKWWRPKSARILTAAALARALEKCDILLPRPRRYWIETNYSHYAHAHHAADLDAAREILKERHPAYVAAFDAVMKRTWGHRFNMLVMGREKLDAYCTWLFDVLFTLEERLDVSAYSPYNRRVFGFVAERLLDVWLETNGYPCRELPYVFTEKQNWLKKGGAFVLRKILRGGKRRDVCR